MRLCGVSGLIRGNEMAHPIQKDLRGLSDGHDIPQWMLTKLRSGTVMIAVTAAIMIALIMAEQARLF